MASMSPMPVSHDQLQRSDSQTSTNSDSSSHSSRGRTPIRSAKANKDDDHFPPGDARGMSPRRTEPECGELESKTRQAVKAHAAEMQRALSDIAESIKMVREDYEKLEKQNMALQDYIGNLTKTVGREAPGGRKKNSKKVRA